MIHVLQDGDPVDYSFYDGTRFRSDGRNLLIEREDAETLGYIAFGEELADDLVICELSGRVVIG